MRVAIFFSQLRKHTYLVHVMINIFIFVLDSFLIASQCIWFVIPKKWTRIFCSALHMIFKIFV